MSSVGEGAARGLQAGWTMGMQADQAERQRALDERQAAQQDRQFGLQEQSAQRAQATADAALARQNAQTDRQNAQDDYKLLNDQLGDVVKRSAAYQSQGQPVPPELAQEYGQVAGALRTHREKVLAPRLAAQQVDDARYWSDVQAGKTDPNTTPPAELYARLSRYTGMLPEDIGKAAQGAQLVQQGFETGNQQMLMQGVNQIAAKDLKAGVGSPSPHGGVVTRKEIVGLIPVKDANGTEHPDKVFPVVRTYVMHPNGAGAEDYYDAPLTQNRTSDPNDPPKALDLNHAFDYMGKVGAMAALLQDPTLSAKLAQGAKEVGDQTKDEVDTITSLGRYHLQEAAKGAVAQKLQAIIGAMPPGPEREKAIAQALGAAPSSNTVARVESAEKVAGMKITSAEKVAADRNATSIKTKGMGTSTTGATSAGGKPLVDKNGAALTGEALLAKLSPEEATTVRRINQGLVDPKNLSIRKGGTRERLLKLAGQYDPTFDEASFGTHQGTERAFSVGVEGRKVRAFNVALEHLNTLEGAAKALDNGDITPLNSFANALGVKAGQDPATTFKAIAQVVSSEGVAALVNGGGALADRKEFETNLSTDMSPKQYLGVHKALVDLMGGQMKGLYQQYRSGGGAKDFNVFLTGAGRAAARGIGAEFEAPRSSAPAGIAPVAPMGGSGAPPTKTQSGATVSNW